MKQAIFDNVVVDRWFIVSKADNSKIPDFEKTVSEIIMIKKRF
jgi:hypothetical protein